MARHLDKESVPSGKTEYITAVALDESSLTARSSAHAHERQVAVNDIIDWNHFTIKGTEGPYTLTLNTAESRMVFSVAAPKLKKPVKLAVPLAPFRSVFRDYALICESYFEAVKTGNMPRIEAIDMSRRGLHNEGAELLAGLLSDKVNMDSETSRRLYTLLYVLHLK